MVIYSAIYDGVNLNSKHRYCVSFQKNAHHTDMNYSLVQTLFTLSYGLMYTLISNSRNAVLKTVKI